MSIIVTNIASGYTNNFGNLFTTVPINVVAGRTYTLSIITLDSSYDTVSSINSANGITWTRVGSNVTVDNNTYVGYSKMSLWTGVASFTLSNVSWIITFNQTTLIGCYNIDEIQGVTGVIRQNTYNAFDATGVCSGSLLSVNPTNLVYAVSGAIGNYYYIIPSLNDSDINWSGMGLVNTNNVFDNTVLISCYNLAQDNNINIQTSFVSTSALIAVEFISSVSHITYTKTATAGLTTVASRTSSLHITKSTGLTATASMTQQYKSSRVNYTKTATAGLTATVKMSSKWKQANPAPGMTTASPINSLVSTGSAPLNVLSTTVCTNLNADLLDGQNGSYYLNSFNKFDMTFESFTAVNGTYTINEYASLKFTIDTVRFKTDSGTVSAAIQINGTNITGLSALSLTSTQGNATASALNTINIGNRVTIILTSAVLPTNAVITLNCTRVL